MRYKVVWVESHNPYNWGDTYEEGLKNIQDSLPPDTKQIDIGEDDEWVDLECIDYFEARNPQEAYDYIIDNYDIQNDVFSIYDMSDNRVATEEGVDDV